MRYDIILILFLSLCVNVSFAASSSEDWLLQRKEKMLAAPDTLKSAIENNWFQIPQRDLLNAKAESAYERQVRPQLDGKLGAASVILRLDIEASLTRSTFDSFAKRHDQKAQISWCDWMWAGFLSDGRPPSVTDAHDALFANCRTKAKQALSDMVLTRARGYPVDLTSLPNLDDQFPAWIVADLGLRGKDAGQNKPMDVTTLEASYTYELKKRLDAMLDQMQSAIDSHFTGLNWKTAKLTSTRRVCEKLLGDPNRLSGAGQAFLKALSEHCSDQSEAWLKARLSEVSGRVSEAMNASIPPTAAISTEGVCQSLVSSWVAPREEPVDFVSKAERLCATNPAAAQRSGLSIVAAIRDLEASLRQLRPTVGDALGSGWMRMRPETIMARVAPKDPREKEVVAEIKSNVDANFDKIRQAALDNGRQSITDNYKRGIDDNVRLAEARDFCFSFREKKEPESLELASACKHSEQSLSQQRINLALQRSRVDDPQRVILIGDRSMQAADLVDYAALNGFQTLFDRDRIVFYPFGAPSARLTGRLMRSPDSSNETLATMDPIPGYGAHEDVGATIRCITANYDSIKYDINKSVIDDIRNKSLFDAVVIGGLSVHDMDQCLRARNLFANYYPDLAR
jgi:hypothetical protein